MGNGYVPDDVLAELSTLGAANRAANDPPEEAIEVEELEVNQGPPGPAVKDSRGAETVALLRELSESFGAAIAGLTAAREAVDRLLNVWSMDAEEPARAEKAEPKPLPPKPAPVPSLPNSTPAAESDGPVMVPSDGGSLNPVKVPGEVAPGDEAYQRARERAIARIRGEIKPRNARARVEEEDDDVPFVGQTRVTPIGADSGEQSIGTLGTVKLTSLLAPGGRNGAEV